MDSQSCWDSPYFCFSAKDPLIPLLLKTFQSRFCTSSTHTQSPAGFGRHFSLWKLEPKVSRSHQIGQRSLNINKKKQIQKAELKKKELKSFKTEKTSDFLFTQTFYAGHFYPTPYEREHLFPSLLSPPLTCPFGMAPKTFSVFSAWLKPLCSVRVACQSRCSASPDIPGNLTQDVWHHQPALPLPPSCPWVNFIHKLNTQCVPWCNHCSSLSKHCLHYLSQSFLLPFSSASELNQHNCE